jgi:hypothetical protein
MSLETEVVAKYGPLFNGRIWFRQVPDEIPREQLDDPFCIVTHAGGRSRVYVDNTLSEDQNARLEFTVWGNRVTEVMQAARLLRNAVIASDTVGWQVRLYGEPVADYDDILKLTGARQDFGIWFKDDTVSPP